MSTPSLGLCLVLVLLLPGLAAAQEPFRLQVGQPLPRIQFPSLEDGRLKYIEPVIGRKTLLIEFASW